MPTTPSPPLNKNCGNFRSLKALTFRPNEPTMHARQFAKSKAYALPSCPVLGTGRYNFQQDITQKYICVKCKADDGENPGKSHTLQRRSVRSSYLANFADNNFLDIRFTPLNHCDYSIQPFTKYVTQHYNIKINPPSLYFCPLRNGLPGCASQSWDDSYFESKTKISTFVLFSERTSLYIPGLVSPCTYASPLSFLNLNLFDLISNSGVRFNFLCARCARS